MGYRRAGFEVVGVDIKPQPRYPFEFHQADAMAFPLNGFDAIHASPPCQAYTLMQGLNGMADKHPRFIEPLRERLSPIARPWVIENVVGAPLRRDLLLCGSMFGLEVRRHRIFETNVAPWLQPFCQCEAAPIAVYGDHPEDSPASRARGINRARTLAEGRRAMGIEWMQWRELCESIPPAYTEFIGKRLIAVLEHAA